MRAIIEPTWTKGQRRTLLRRVQWGVLVGAADIFAGVVSVVSLGQFASGLPLEVALRLTIRESRRMSAPASNRG